MNHMKFIKNSWEDLFIKYSLYHHLKRIKAKCHRIKSFVIKLKQRTFGIESIKCILIYPFLINLQNEPVLALKFI
jgi:hypothetical protein